MSEASNILTRALGGGSGFDFAGEALGIVRSHLGMEVAYLSEFVDGRSVFRAVDAPGFEALAQVGSSFPLEEVYCQHILEGRLPQLIPNTADLPFASTIAITHAIPIGSHVSVPIRRPDGSVYGMFCCISRKPNPSLNDRDLEVMRLFADLTAGEINRSIVDRTQRETIGSNIDAALAPDGFKILYQPIFNLASPMPAGFEALCRFKALPYRTPDAWFAEAALAGRQIELEVAAISKALDALEHLPAPIYVSVNASPETVVHGKLESVFQHYPIERIMLEVTEHAAVADYTELDLALTRLRFMGIKLAIDDAGAGYSGLQHILRLRPDVLKLDMTLTRDIDRDWARRSLAVALVHFASETRAEIVAEGIETQSELETLRGIGVHRGQGYHLGRPADLATAMGWWTPRAQVG